MLEALTNATDDGPGFVPDKAYLTASDCRRGQIDQAFLDRGHGNVRTPRKDQPGYLGV